MKKLLTIVFLMATSLMAKAQNSAVSGYCTLGATSALISGLPSLNTLQGIVPGCTVTVYLSGTQTPATIYATAGGQSLGNPFVAVVKGLPNAGSYLFFAANGAPVDIVLSGGTYPDVYQTPVTVTGVNPGGGGESSGVSELIAGSGITLSPSGGTGEVTISATGGGGGLPSGTGLVAVTAGTGGLATPQIASPTVNGLIPYSGIYCTGDSTVQGTGADNASDDYCALLSKDVPGYRYNLGYSGAWTSDITSDVWLNWAGTSQFDTPLISYEGGINNANYTSGINYVQQSYQDAIAAITHLAIPLSSTLMSSTQTSSSGWTPVTGIPAFALNPALTGTMQQSTTTGNTVTYALPAGANVAYWWGAATASAGTFKVSVNGTFQINYCTGTTTFDSFGCNGQIVASNFNAGYAIFGQVFSGNAGSANSIIITVTSATGAGNIVYDVAAATVPATFPNVIGVQGVIPQYLDANATATAGYNTSIQSAYTNLTAHGFSNLYFIDVRNGVPAGVGYPAARALNTTTDFSGSASCPGGVTPLHPNSCGYSVLEKLNISSAAAAGFPISINNVGGANMVNAPLLYYTGQLPFSSDFRYDMKLNPFEVFSASTRMPGICFAGGSLITGDINSKCNMRISFEQSTASGIASTKFLNEGNAYPWVFALGSPGVQNPATDVNYASIFPGSLGNFFQATTHLGATTPALVGTFPSQTAPFTTQSSSFGYSVESEERAASANHTATYEYLPTGTTNYAVPACNTSATNSFGNWVQFIIKDNADTGTFTFTPNAVAGDKLNDSTAAASFTNVPQNTLWMLRCTKAGSPNTNIFMQEMFPNPLTLTTTGGSGASVYNPFTNTLNIPIYTGGGGGSVTNFTAPSGSWPTWLVPTVTNATTTPNLAVAASAIPNSALANASTTVNGQTCTLGATCTISSGSGTVTASPQYDIPYYSATGTASTVTGASVSGLAYFSTSAAPVAATGVNVAASFTGTPSASTYLGGDGANHPAVALGTAGQYAVMNAGGTTFSPTSISGDSTSSASTPGLMTNIGLNGVVLSSLASGILRNTTSTGAPGIETAAQLATDVTAGLKTLTNCNTSNSYYFSPFSGTCVLVGGGSPTVYVSGTGAAQKTGVGPTSFPPAFTFQMFDATPTTGSTNGEIEAGAGQSGDLLDIDPNGIGYHYVRFDATGNLYMFSQFKQLSNTTLFGAFGVVPVLGDTASLGTAKTTATTATTIVSSRAFGPGGTLQEFEVDCYFNTKVAVASSSISVTLSWTDDIGVKTSTPYTLATTATTNYLSIHLPVVATSTGSTATNMTYAVAIIGAPQYGGTCWGKGID